jgi:hypothetical protein
MADRLRTKRGALANLPVPPLTLDELACLREFVGVHTRRFDWVEADGLNGFGGSRRKEETLDALTLKRLMHTLEPPKMSSLGRKALREYQNVEVPEDQV